MKKSDSERFTLNLMESTPAVYLATVDEQGLPHVRAVSNLRDKRQYPSLRGFFQSLENQFVTYITTYATSEKAKHIRRNPRAAIYYSRPERFFGVMLSGAMEAVRDRAVKQTLWQEEWLTFWSKGPRDPRYRVFRFEPDWARGWNGEQVFRFAMQAPKRA